MKRLILTVALVVIPTISFGLSDNYKFSILENLDIALSKNSRYVWGATGTEKNGIFAVDCSGLGFFLVSAIRKAGIPIKRTTSERMSYGKDGWDSVEVDINDAEEADIIFFTFGKDRPRGHVGYMKIHRKSNLLMVVHASSSRKRVAQEGVKGELLDHFTVMRRLTWGDKQKTVLGKGIIQTK